MISEMGGAGNNNVPALPRRISMKTYVLDPVCGGLIVWEKAAAVLSYHGTLHYFCSIRCRKRFQHAPAKFIEPIQVLSGVP